MNPVEKSICVYEAILADVRDYYPQTGGGGITSIRQAMTTSYEVTIAHEGRRDIITYEISVTDDGAVQIKDRVETSH